MSASLPFPAFPLTAKDGRRMLHRLAGALLLAALAACAAEPSLPGTVAVRPDTTHAAPTPDLSAMPPAEAARVARGQYLVALLGCGTCHTDGALMGAPQPERLLAGSSVGIAWSDPLVQALPGVVFPANLTPDRDTGIGNWTARELVQVLRSGIDRGGRQHLPVMPWPAYARLSDDDAGAIAAYLLSLPPVRHEVPTNVSPGQRTDSTYVHFGVYRKM